MSDNLRNYVKALYGLDAVVARTDSSQWGNASPCDGWTAAHVLAHNVGMCDMIAGFTRSVAATGPSLEVAEDPRSSWKTSLDGLLAALDRPGALQAVAKTPWGQMAVDKFLGFSWIDPLVHTWDVAKATGQIPALDGDQVERGIVQLTRAGASLVAPGRFAAAVQVSAAAGQVDRLVALSGRSPA